MPKIIENARGLLIDEARRQVYENGYEAVTIRSIARGCSIGLGTFYNYFKSKDMLIATFLLEDWQSRLANLEEASVSETNPMTMTWEVYRELDEFIKNNLAIFSSVQAAKAFNNSVGDYHKILRKQLANPIRTVLEKGSYEETEYLSLFVAEAILCWRIEKRSFDELSPVINKLFK